MPSDDGWEKHFAELPTIAEEFDNESALNLL